MQQDLYISNISLILGKETGDRRRKTEKCGTKAFIAILSSVAAIAISLQLEGLLAQLQFLLHV